MIKYVKGDLFDMVEPGVIIPHVCNNQNKWGRGFVVPLIKHYLSAREAFDEWYRGKMQDAPEFQLGQAQIVEVDDKVLVANMVAQVFYVRDGGLRQTRPLYYNHLMECMYQVGEVCLAWNYRILAPKFGSELAGGNWEFVEALIYDIWIECGIDVTVVEYDK